MGNTNRKGEEYYFGQHFRSCVAGCVDVLLVEKFRRDWRDSPGPSLLYREEAPPLRFFPIIRAHSRL